MLSLSSRPESTVLYDRAIHKEHEDGRKWVVARWLVTKEDFGFALWRGQCLDAQPWDESDWAYELMSIWPKYAREEAIRHGVLGAERETTTGEGP